MSKNEARRQKQLAKKKAKRDEKRSHLTRPDSEHAAIKLAAAQTWPIAEALVPANLWEQGMGQLVLARRLPDGRLACGIYLVDVYCLGVKNAFWKIMSDFEYDKFKIKINAVGRLQPVAPEYFAKLVLAAVDYAQALGFSPHRDYGAARLLLAGIDPTLCSDTFTFGKDGKPLYINGPYDSPEKIKFISERLKLAGGETFLYLKEGSSLVRALSQQAKEEMYEEEPT